MDISAIEKRIDLAIEIYIDEGAGVRRAPWRAMLRAGADPKTLIVSGPIHAVKSNPSGQRYASLRIVQERDDLNHSVLAGDRLESGKVLPIRR